MRNVTLIASLALLALSGVAIAQETAAPLNKPGVPSAASPSATGAEYTTANTKVGVLMADANAKAVLAKHIPDFVNDPQSRQAWDITLREVQKMAPSYMTDKILAAIDVDLAKLPLKK